MNKTLLTLAACLLLAAILPLHASAQNDEAIEERRLELRFILEPGPQNVAELNMNMEEGGHISWFIRTTDDRQILLDLHSHITEDECRTTGTWDPDGGYCLHLEPTTTRTLTSTFTAPLDGVFSFMMERQEVGAANVLITVQGEFGVHSMHNIDAIEHGSAPPLIALIAAVGLLLAGIHRARRGAPPS